MLDKNEIYTLGIETSCDETAAAVVKNGRFILSNSILSQTDIHKKFGGVVPEVASRAHIESISDIVDDALYNANITFSDIDVVAVTYGPGLVGALLVGVSYAKSLAYAIKKSLIGVNHIEAHICSNYLDYIDLKPPFVALVVSGGHTHLFYVSDYGSYKLLGRTRDDAVGEAYDKVARSIGLDYPGGPKIDILAQRGDPNKIKFPKSMLEQDSLDFSFSGIKSSVLNYINKCNMNRIPIVKEDIAASFQKSIVDVLCKKAIRACEISDIDKLVLAGGVGSNMELRKELNIICTKKGFSFYVPRPILCTDNAAMVASCGFYSFIQNRKSSLSLNASPNLNLINDFVK